MLPRLGVTCDLGISQSVEPALNRERDTGNSLLLFSIPNIYADMYGTLFESPSLRCSKGSKAHERFVEHVQQNQCPAVRACDV
jgi:hypothetical protein